MIFLQPTTISPTSPQPRRWQILDATQLKLLACALMFLDHVHQMFVAQGAPMWLTMLGRPVFPLFLFACAESFHYTHSKGRYLGRLLVASWCMTLFTFVLQRLVPNPDVVLMNNAFSTFFVAGVFMLGWDQLRQGLRQRAPGRLVKGVLIWLVPILCAAPLWAVASLSFNADVSPQTIRLLAALALFFPNVLAVEGGLAMVALGLAFYILRPHRVWQIAALLALAALVWAMGDPIQALMGLAALPIALYNGARGRGMKQFFYIFYPAHIGLLYLASSLLS